MDVQTALQNLVAVIKAHELESLSCDRDGQTWCECLDEAIKNAEKALNPEPEEEVEYKCDSCNDTGIIQFGYARGWSCGCEKGIEIDKGMENL